MNSFGKIFRVSIAGESHGSSVSVMIDGVPPGIPFTIEDMLNDLKRRKSGKKGTTPRIEPDSPSIMSGVFNDFTTGAPILIVFANTNTRSRDYSILIKRPRPGNADLTGMQKYNGFNDYRGGGHFSGRLTLGLVAAGTLAKKIISPMELKATLIEAGGSTNIEKAINSAIENEDSIGGIVECCVTEVKHSLGEPFFDSVESMLSHGIFSIPGIRGIEFGSGFASSKMSGSTHNDPIITTGGKTLTNYSGGINGGITNGNNLVFRVAVKPTASISKSQQTINMKTGITEELSITGRHDCCFALRVPPVLEAVTAIVLSDLLMIHNKNALTKN